MFFCCLVVRSCLTLCDPMDYSPPGSSVRGIFQARILEWVAISFSRGSLGVVIWPVPANGMWVEGVFHFWDREREFIFSLYYLPSPNWGPGGSRTTDRGPQITMQKTSLKLFGEAVMFVMLSHRDFKFHVLQHQFNQHIDCSCFSRLTLNTAAPWVLCTHILLIYWSRYRLASQFQFYTSGRKTQTGPTWDSLRLPIKLPTMAQTWQWTPPCQWRDRAILKEDNYFNTF